MISSETRTLSSARRRDAEGWAFTPTALYIQQEVHSSETPDAVRLSAAEAQEIAVRVSLSENSKQKVLTMGSTSGNSKSSDSPEGGELPEVEIGGSGVEESRLQEVIENLELAPPVPFDVARRVRVFHAYIQYVDIKLRGCAIERRRVNTPKSIAGTGPSSELEDRQRTTFELIRKDDKVSSQHLERELATIRDTFTRSLGRPWGRIMLRSNREAFGERIDQFREKLKAHQREVQARLDETLDESRAAIIEYFLLRIRETPQGNRTLIA